MEDVANGLKVYSPQSPLGAAIIGASKGDTVSYEAPNGKTLEVSHPRRGAVHGLRSVVRFHRLAGETGREAPKFLRLSGSFTAWPVKLPHSRTR